MVGGEQLKYSKRRYRIEMYAVVADFSRVLYRPIPAPALAEPRTKAADQTQGTAGCDASLFSEQAIVGISGMASTRHDNGPWPITRGLHQQQVSGNILARISQTASLCLCLDLSSDVLVMSLGVMHPIDRSRGWILIRIAGIAFHD
jgi:hypothetical protein